MQHFKSKQLSPRSSLSTVVPNSNISSPDTLSPQEQPPLIKFSQDVSVGQKRSFSQLVSLNHASLENKMATNKKRKLESHPQASTTSPYLNSFTMSLASAMLNTGCHAQHANSMNTQPLEQFYPPSHPMDNYLPIEYDGRNDNLEVNEHLLDEIFRFLQ